MKQALLAALLLSSCGAFAADVTTLQAALESARQDMLDAKSRYESAHDARVHQEKHVSDLKADLARQEKTLADDVLREKAAGSGYEAAKKKHDEAQGVLDRAWNGH